MNMAFDDLMEYVGGHHRYQILATILMAYGELINSLQCLQPILTAPPQKYLCSMFDWDEAEQRKYIPELNTVFSNSSYDSHAKIGRNGSVFINDQCSVYLNDTGQSFECTAWTFDTRQFKSTINSRYNLVCGRDPLSHASTSIYYLGHLIGCSLYGSFSDRYGRLKMILVSALNIVIFSLAAAFVSSPYSTSGLAWYFVLRLLVGVGVGGLFTVSLTMEAEVVGSKRRVYFFMMTHAGSSIGAILLAVLGMCIRDHFWIQLAAVLPMALYLAYPFLLCESPRWMISNKRFQEAERVLRKMARFNGRQVPDDFGAQLQMQDPLPMTSVADSTTFVNGREVDDEGQMHERCHSNCQDTLLPLFKSRSLAFTTIQIWGAWFVANLAYSGSYFNVGEIGGDIFINLIITSAMELPAHVSALFLSKRIGRRATVCIAFTGGAACCLINSCIIGEPSFQIVVQILSMIGQFWFTTAYDTVIFYSCEIFPTVTRNLAVGIGSTMARLGGMTAPQVTLLFHVWRPGPLLLLGALAGSCGMMVLIFLPETLNRSLPETLEEWSTFVHANRRPSLRRKSDATQKKRQQSKTEEDIAEEVNDDKAEASTELV